MNRSIIQRLKKSQRGAALVEMAIVISLFFVMVFGIIEFAIAFFDWSRTIESTRAGARYAIVHDPVCSGVMGLREGDSPISCSPAAGNDLVDVMQNIMPRIEADDIAVTYAWSATGNELRPEEAPIPSVTVGIKQDSVEFNFIVLDALLDLLVPDDSTFPNRIYIPPFATTRTGEDLNG